MRPPQTPRPRSVALWQTNRYTAIIAAAATITLVASATTAYADDGSADRSALSTATNVEVIVEKAAAKELPKTLGRTRAENLLADSVISEVFSAQGIGEFRTLTEQRTELRTLADQGREVRVDIRETSDDSAFGVAIITAPEEVGATPDGWLFAAEHSGKDWSVGLEGSPEFSAIVKNTPLLEADEREALADYTDPNRMTTYAATGLALPYAIGTSQVMTGGPHGMGGYDRPYSSLDFSGGNRDVRAARSGYAYSLCWGWTRVIHDNGYSTDYYHLENYQHLPGNNVGTGHYLGSQGNSVCAGGSSTGAHVHFALRGYSDPNAAGWYVALHGRTLGGWTFYEGAAYNGYAYRSGVGYLYPGSWVYNYGLS